MNLKQRLSASVDADLIVAAEEAVATGRAASVSAWVNEALRLKLAHERRLHALAAFVEAHERAQGPITGEEMEQAARRSRGRAVAVRGQRRRGPAAPRRRTG
jgi:hypothetical protein